MNAVAGGNGDGCFAAKEQHSLGQYKAQRSNVDNFVFRFGLVCWGDAHFRHCCRFLSKQDPLIWPLRQRRSMFCRSLSSTRRDNRNRRALGNVAGSAPAFHASPFQPQIFLVDACHVSDHAVCRLWSYCCKSCMHHIGRIRRPFFAPQKCLI
jgi:hypothetical protein